MMAKISSETEVSGAPRITPAIHYLLYKIGAFIIYVIPIA